MSTDGIINTIVFDIGRVLIGFEWDEYVSSLFEPEVAKRVTTATFGSEYWKELDRGVMSMEDIIQSFIDIDPEMTAEILEAVDRVGECTTHQDYAIPWIEELQERGYNVLYLSNYSEHVRNASTHALDFIPSMNGGIFSCDIQCIKPDEKIYMELFDTYGLKPEECVFIDDTPANIEAAKKLGMKGIVFENYEQAHAELDQLLASHV